MKEDIENLYTYEELMKLGIFELRKLGQDVGVISPTSLKKETLVQNILSIIYGEAPKRKIGKGRGRPPKNNPKPCKLYLDLVEKIEQPKVETDFIYSSSSGLKDLVGYDKVASVKSPYLNEGDPAHALKRGVVCEEDGKFFVRKLKYISSEEDKLIDDDLVTSYNLKDGDTLEYLPDSTLKKVMMIIKKNGYIAKRQTPAARVNVREIPIEENVVVRTGETNIFYAKTAKERESLNEKIFEQLKRQNCQIVRINFDSFDLGKKQLENVSEYYCLAKADEYETITITDAGTDRAKFLASIGENVALIIDNLGWLMSVVETFPKYLYGTYIGKLGKISKEFPLITLVSVVSDITKEDAIKLSSLFDNVNINESLN